MIQGEPFSVLCMRGNRLYLLLVVILLLGGCKEKKQSEVLDGKSEGTSTQEVPEKTEEITYSESGKAVYDTYCLSCHQATGDGVPGLNPSLYDSPLLNGSKEDLLEVVIYGSTRSKSETQSEYTNNMPSFESLGDQQIADVVLYISQAFGEEAVEVSAEEVAAFKAKN